MAPEKPRWPKTLEAAVNRVIEMMDENSKQTLRQTPFRDLIGFHFFAGMTIRNVFGLWQGNQELLDSSGYEEPDGCSMKIIEEVWRRLQTTDDAG